jgi:hypothetical protein
MALILLTKADDIYRKSIVINTRGVKGARLNKDDWLAGCILK